MDFCEQWCSAEGIVMNVVEMWCLFHTGFGRESLMIYTEILLVFYGGIFSRGLIDIIYGNGWRHGLCIQIIGVEPDDICGWL
ncbi:hypothetical protein CHS0354_018594, partial [Potamilus streckersoni]